MTIQAEFLARALHLPSEDRAEIARQLILSLEPASPESDISESNVNEAWKVEIEKRLGEIDRGEVLPVEWREAVERMQKNLDRHGPE